MTPMHAPPDYACPFCALAAHGENGLNAPADVVYRDAHVTAFISPRAWPRNRGHVLVIPNVHVESLYEIEPATHHRVVDLAQRVALALKQGYGCDGVSTRQHNEPAGNQDVWHFHLHVFPRYHGDDLYASRPEPGWLDPAERAAYAARLRPWLEPRPAES